MMPDPRDWKAIFPLTLCLFLLLGSVANAPSRNTKRSHTKTPAGEPKSSTPPELRIKPLRAKARSLLASLSTDARNFRDQTLRARPDEALKLVIESRGKRQSSIRNKYISEVDLEGIAGDPVVKNYDRAVELATGFQAVGPRAVNTTAIARAILNPKKGATAQ